MKNNNKSLSIAIRILEDEIIRYECGFGFKTDKYTRDHLLSNLRVNRDQVAYALRELYIAVGKTNTNEDLMYLVNRKRTSLNIDDVKTSVWKPEAQDSSHKLYFYCDDEHNHREEGCDSCRECQSIPHCHDENDYCVDTIEVNHNELCILGEDCSNA